MTCIVYLSIFQDMKAGTFELNADLSFVSILSYIYMLPYVNNKCSSDAITAATAATTTFSMAFSVFP